MSLRLLILFLFFVSTHLLNAQDSKTGNWFIYFGNQAINKKWNWHNEVQYRNYNFAGDLQQLMLRTGIGYNLTEKNNNVLLGYGYIRSENYVGDTDIKLTNEEHRIFEQYINRHQLGRVFFQHRFRIEERFLKNKFEIRGRYFLGINIPINKSNLDKGAIYASLYNETFLNFQNNVFDRNRAYAALGYVLHKNLKIEIGFMAQTLKSTNRNQFQIVLFNNFPFRND